MVKFKPMPAVLVKNKVNEQDLLLAKKESEDLIIVVVDVSSGTMAIGGEWHADAKQLLLSSGSQPDSLWGGSLNLLTKKVEPTALINVRPELGNDSQEILNPQIREKFTKIVKEKFNL